MSVDELGEVGLERMTDEEIRTFLGTRGFGVLGLPGEDVPYVIPMSFGFDGESSLYFTYILGESSRKEALTDRAERARFLVYEASSPYTWESVLLTGTVEPVDPEGWGDLSETLSSAWHPAIFDEASVSRGVRVYRFEAEELSGIRHTGLPEGLEPHDPESV